MRLLLFLELILFIFLFIPTLMALVSGAPWVPTPMGCVKRMLELARIKKGERVYDLGCGDGRMVHLAASQYGADAVGLELSPFIYLLGRVRNFLLKSPSQILFRDFRSVNFKNADVIVFYLLPAVLKTMRPKLEQELKPGARIISYAFAVEGWTPVHIEPKVPEKNYCKIFVYEMPQSWHHDEAKLMAAHGREAKK